MSCHPFFVGILGRMHQPPPAACTCIDSRCASSRSIPFSLEHFAPRYQSVHPASSPSVLLRGMLRPVCGTNLGRSGHPIHTFLYFCCGCHPQCNSSRTTRSLSMPLVERHFTPVHSAHLVDTTIRNKTLGGSGARTYAYRNPCSKLNGFKHTPSSSHTSTHRLR